MYVCNVCDVLLYAYLCGGSMGQHVLPIGIPDAVQPFHRSLISFLTDDLHLLIHLEMKSNRNKYKRQFMARENIEYLYEASIGFNSCHIQTQPYCAGHSSCMYI